MDQKLKLKVVHADHVNANLYEDILRLCNNAYEEDLTQLFSTFKDATHVLGYFDTKLVSHALWVTRWLQVGSSPLIQTAYVEAVATEVEFQAQGLANKIMKRVAEEIRGFELGALSQFSVVFYERLGWELWRGPLYIRKDDELLRTPRDGDVMILRLPLTPELDLHAPLSAEWRAGELW